MICMIYEAGCAGEQAKLVICFDRHLSCHSLSWTKACGVCRKRRRAADKMVLEHTRKSELQ